MGSVPPILLVAAGGSAGAAARFALSEWIASRAPDRFPWGTLVVNLTGCLAAGFLLERMQAQDAEGRAWRALVASGFLGAYTTFSAFSWETLAFARAGAWGRAGLYAGSSLVLGLLAAAAGVAASRALR